MTTEEKVKGRKVGVIGMARSGVAAALLARKHGAAVFVSDSAPGEKLVEPAKILGTADISYETGGHTDLLLSCDYLVVSPGVALTTGVLATARERGIPVFSELEFSSWFCPGRIVAVTGSNGKTTTTTLIGEILIAGGIDTHVCGNIGRPLGDVVSSMTGDSVAVVEVSSFQLESIADFRPNIAVILNLSPDHLDRHADFENYKQAKYRVTENQEEDDYFILNRDDRELVADNLNSSARRRYFSVGRRNGVSSFVEDDRLFVQWGSDFAPVLGTNEIALPGPHNLQNASAAVVVASLLRVPPKTMADVLREFPGVEHRLESVARVAGIEFINDSKATNVDSVCWALKSMAQPVYLILGGRDKGASYRPIIDAGRDKIKGLLLLGEAKDKIFRDLGKSFPSVIVDSLEEAVARGFEMAIPGETVLLSPGCASFDMFDNYEQRGRRFKSAVAALRNNRNSNEKVSG
jgi:UDP-N-acetylmuramoylalanine--D-glutamate ligase